MRRLSSWFRGFLESFGATIVPSRVEPHVSSAATAETRLHDLRDEHRFLFALLNDFSSWRERLIEEIVIDDGDHVTTSSSYQIRLPVDTVRRFAHSVRSGDSVRMLVPLTTRPKDLLLGVDLIGPNGSNCFLLLKEQISWLQREYVYTLLGDPERTAGAAALLYGISNYSHDVWREFDVPGADGPSPLAAYLDDGLPFGVDADTATRWQSAAQPLERLLSEALGEPPDESSAAEHLLRALPFADELPHSVEQVDAWLNELSVLLEGADDTARAVIAEYGRRWEVIVEAVLPVGEPCKVKFCTRRPWNSRAADRTTQRVPIGDASSAHIELRIADHSIEFCGPPSVTDLQGEPLGVPIIDSMRLTSDTAAIYVRNSDETPYFVDVSVRLRPRLPIRVLLWSIWLMVVVAISVALVLPENEQLADNLALLTFPLTLAGAIVLSRDSSAISHRVQERSRTALAMAVASLWAIAASRLLAVEVEIEWIVETGRSARDVLERLRLC